MTESEFVGSTVGGAVVCSDRAETVQVAVWPLSGYVGVFAGGDVRRGEVREDVS